MNEHEEHEKKLLHLEILKALRPKLSQLENLKVKILCEVENYTKEISCVEESERELEILKFEKTLHEEAIRSLGEDMKQLSSSVDQSKDEQNASKLRVRELISEFNPLKHEVDEVRVSIGLDVLPKLTEADIMFKDS